LRGRQRRVALRARILLCQPLFLLPGASAEVQKVANHGTSLFREDALGMKLHTFNGVLLVSHALYDALGAIFSRDPRRHLETLGHGGMGASQRVVPGDLYILSQTGIHTLGIMDQGRCLAVEVLPSRLNLAAKDVDYALP